MANTEVWQEITRRIGRWVDFENDYSTMDLDFMESVWWVFRQLWDKGLVYRDFKVLPYSYGAATPLSNFEVNLGAYRDVEDPSITVRLEVTEGAGPVEAGDWLLIWTTTPWTMPSNLGVAVGPDIRYIRVDRPLGGLDGTLEDRLEKPARPVRAKTGHLSGVVALCGMVPDAAGRLLVFAVLVNGARGPVEAVDAALGSFVIGLGNGGPNPG